MKIRNIRFQNISSLSGEYEIDFDRSPLADSGIFAITGPNGAGKSSILDAITLALYGETPRLKNPGEEMMSKDSRDSFSAVTFSVNGSMYRAHWQIRKKGKKTEAPQMKLFSINGGEILMDEKISTVRRRMEELTGLDFKRFCRSVMLAQGEFASFLHALDSERAEIMEKIIGPEIRSAYEKHVFRKTGNENDRLLRLQEEKENFSLPEQRDIREKQEQLSQLAEQLAQAEKDLSLLEEKKEKSAHRQKLQQEYENAQLALAHAQSRREKMQDSFRKAEKARKAAPIRSSLDKLETLGLTRDSLLQQAAETENAIPGLEKQLRILNEQKEKNESELENARKELARKKENIEHALEITRQTENAREQYRRHVEDYELLEKKQHQNLAEQNALGEEIKENQNAQTEKEKWLSKNSSDASLAEELGAIRETNEQLLQIRANLKTAGQQHREALKAEKKAAGLVKKSERSLESTKEKIHKILRGAAQKEKSIQTLLGDDCREDLEKQYDEKKEQQCRIKKMLKIARQHSKKTHRRHGIFGKPDSELTETEKKYEDLNRLLEEEQNIYTSLHQAAAALRFASERAELRSGEPCPLCGSTEHPFVSEGLPYGGDPRRALKDQHSKVRNLQKQSDALGDELRKLHSKNRKAEMLREEWEEIAGNASDDWNIEDVKNLKNKFREMGKEIRNLKIRLKSISKYRKQENKFRNILEIKKDKSAEQKMVHERLQNDLNIQQGVRAALAKEREEIRQREKEQEEMLRVQLEKYGESIPEAGNEMQIFLRLEERKENYSETVRESQNLKLQEAELKEKKEKLPEELKNMKKETERLEKEIQKELETITELKERREREFGPEDPVQLRQELENSIREKREAQTRIAEETESLKKELTERQKQKKETEEKSEEIIREYADAKNSLHAQCLAAGFRNPEEIREYMMTAEELEEITRIQKETERNIEENNARLRSIQEMPDSDRDTEAEKLEKSENIDEIIAEKQKIRAELAAEYDRAETKLKINESLLQEYETKRREIEEQEKICDKLNKEKSLLESGTEAEVRKGAQDYMLSSLLKKGNHYMEELSGHYYIRRKENSEVGGMGLEMEDIRHKGARRPLKSLSGGESFLASISLALGLSEMACEDRKIESLFLDEGFGSLDEETLYKVIRMLKNIKTGGKMIGVISHVKKLSDEIPTQIRIEKLPDGSRRMDIIPEEWDGTVGTVS